jgi:large subunit ribosomal protein L25
MSDKVTVKAEVREGRGKEDSKKMRREGKIPAIVYGAGKETTAVSVSLAELASIIRSDSGHNTVFSLDINGETLNDVIFHERQIHPLTGRLIHADLRRLFVGEKIEMLLPVHIIGEAVGMSEEGANLSQPIHELKVLCDPSKAPEAIEVDVTELKMGDAIHVSDLKVEAGIEFHDAPDTVVVAVTFLAEENLDSAVETGVEPEVTGEKTPEPGK